MHPIPERIEYMRGMKWIKSKVEFVVSKRMISLGCMLNEMFTLQFHSQLHGFVSGFKIKSFHESGDLK
jgi:hypothetical protein